MGVSCAEVLLRYLNDLVSTPGLRNSPTVKDIQLMKVVQ